MMHIGDPQWGHLVTKGECRNHPDPDIFHPSVHADRKRQIAAAKQVCAECGVRQECLDYALSMYVRTGDIGIWGGTTPAERRVIRRERNQRAAAAWVNQIASQL